MKLYAELPGVRARQIVSDVAAALGVGLFVRAGMWLHHLVSELAGPGRAIEDAGATMASSMDLIGDAIDDLPVVGRVLRAPFARAANAGTALADAGRSQQEVVITIALWVAAIFAAAGSVAILTWWLPRRITWVREATAAVQLRDAAGDLRLFAYRAVANRSLPVLRRVVPDPGRALADGNFDTLAAVELESLGLRTVRPAR